VAAADLNGDTTIDLVSANDIATAGTVTVTLNTLGASANATSAQTGYPSAEYEDLGVKVKATPRLHPDGDVTIQMQFDIKNLTGSSINGIPILSNRAIEQTVRLRENETSILSGVLQSNKMGGVSGLPWTSLAPGIGLLTGEDTTNNQQSELLILVTPRALRLPPHEGPAVYAGRGEPSSPASAPPPIAAPVPLQPPPGAGAAPGQAPVPAGPPPQQPDQQQPQEEAPPRPLQPMLQR
jgi:general secretion pathway protein D